MFESLGMSHFLFNNVTFESLMAKVVAPFASNRFPTILHTYHDLLPIRKV